MQYSVEPGITIETELPESLRGTAGHLNCPQEYVPIVKVRHKSHERPYVFRGTVVKTEWDSEPDSPDLPLIRPGMVAVSAPKEFGMDTHHRFFPAESVSRV